MNVSKSGLTKPEISGWPVMRIPACALAVLALGAQAHPARAASVSVAIPAYFSPSDTTDWNNIISNASKISVVIINPYNGPDPSEASSYQTLYSQLHTAGIRVLGYVHTLGGCRPYATNYNYTSSPDETPYGTGVEGDIATYASEGICDGIFLDEGPGTGTYNAAIANYSAVGYTYKPNPSLSYMAGTTLQYYQPLRAYIQSLTWPNGESPSIALNPGDPTDEQYLYDASGANTKNGVADIICDVEEDSYANYMGSTDSWLEGQFSSGGGAYWVYSHSPSHFWQIAYSFASQASEVTNAVSQAETWNADFVYFTDSTTPYSTLPGSTVWSALVGASSGVITLPSGGSSGSAPAAPTGLTATPGNAQVALAWTASTGATSYNIYRSTTSGGEGTTALVSGITTAAFTNTGLTNGTTYYYTVAAVNASGTSAQSSQVSAKPVASVPAAPTGLTATAGYDQVGLTWSPSTGATSYNVYRGTASGSESATAIATGITGATKIFYTNQGLANGTTYYYEVKAVNSGGTSAYSSQVSAAPSSSDKIYDETESISDSTMTLSFHYTGTSWTYYQVYLDTDQSAATGYTGGISTVGADYLIENGSIYKSTANGTGWSWGTGTAVTSFSNSGGVVTWTLPLSDFGSPAAVNYFFEVNNSSTTFMSSVFTY